MTILSVNNSGELHLTLTGQDENRILTTMRRCPYWLRATVERDPKDPSTCVSVTLIADIANEAMVREILKRGFGMSFPPEGGSCPLPPVQSPPVRKRAW